MQCRCCIWFGYLCCFKCVVNLFYCVVCVIICIPVICVIVRVSLQKTACSKWPSLLNDDGDAESPVCDEVTFSLSSCDECTVFSIIELVVKAMRHPTPEFVFHAAACIHLILVSFHVNVLTTLLVSMKAVTQKNCFLFSLWHREY